MIRLLMIVTGLITVSVLLIAVRADPHLWGQAAHVLDHRARGAGTDLNARLSGWITPGPGTTP